MNTNNQEQSSQYEQWRHERLAHFTSSEIWKLTGKGRAKDEYFSETAFSYILDKVGELCTMQPARELDTVEAIEYGYANEHHAMMEFQTRSGLQVDYFGISDPKFFKHELFPEFAGGSPDGLTDDSVIEIKAPFNTAHHIRHLLITDTADLKTIKPQYYWQLQMNMFLTKRQYGIFISYNDRMLDDNKKLHAVKINRNDEDIALLNERIGEAIKQMKVYIDSIEPVEVV